MKRVLWAFALIVIVPREEAFSCQDDRLTKLTQDLGCADPATRERATAELVSIGRPALATLKALEKNASDSEVRSRASSAVREIYEDLRWNALKVEVATDRRKYRPGDDIKVSVRLQNVEDFPVTVYLGESEIETNASVEVVSGRKAVRIVIPSYQVFRMGPVKVDEKRFATIKPGDSLEVRGVTFKERWDLGGKDPGLKASYSEESRRLLEAATYQVKASFAHGFRSKKEKREALLRAKEKEAEKPDDKNRIVMSAIELTPKATDLMSNAWEGALKGHAEFQIADD
jgi:hypothetical protein